MRDCLFELRLLQFYFFLEHAASRVPDAELIFCLIQHIYTLICYVLGSSVLIVLFDVQDAVSLARTEEEPEAAARKLTEAAFSRGSADNITCIVVQFHHEKAELANPDKAEAASAQHE